jgi:hypothetical protein
MATITEELVAVVTQLPPREQERVLSFARAGQSASLPAHPAAAGHAEIHSGTTARLTGGRRGDGAGAGGH